jgi:meiotically up-regulated gene 157 (Mug157) protein
MANVSSLLGVPLIITEKCDGSGHSRTRTSVFSQSHSGPPVASFDLAKATHARIAHELTLWPLALFCELLRRPTR